MAYAKRLGVFAKVPEKAKVKTRLVPPLSEEAALELSQALFEDTLGRLSKLKKISGTLFFSGDEMCSIEPFLPRGYELVPQKGDSLGARLQNAFRHLLEEEGSYAVIIGTDSPDLPLKYIKRAFYKLKHKDAVLGPSADGGYYLIGLKKLHEELFHGISWGERTVLRETLDIIAKSRLSISILPMWYDVDDASSLELLRTMMKAKRLEKSGRLWAMEKFFSRHFKQ